VKRVFFLLPLLFFSGAVRAQMGVMDPDTVCKYNDLLNQLECKKVEVDKPVPSGYEILSKALNDWNKKLDALRAARAAQPAPVQAVRPAPANPDPDYQKNLLDFIHCRQQPNGVALDKQKPCSEVFDYTRAYCVVNPEKLRCNLAKSKEEITKAFDALVSEYRADKYRDRHSDYFGAKFHRYTEWACMSFPDLVVPQQDGQHSCPDAPNALVPDRTKP
jgi:hypothetical protein